MKALYEVCCLWVSNPTQSCKVNLKVEDTSMVMQSFQRAFLKTPTYEACALALYTQIYVFRVFHLQ
eukprot:3192554-Amphidinium_carterae.1